ncbi:MAG: TadE/TadG family type IV pilus assembly protein [Pseudomonadota bacterium]
MGVLKYFIRSKDGTTAVEFSLIAAPFIFMLIGVIEMALMFASASLLEGSAATASRLIRTGQVQQAGGSQAMFEDTLCDFASPLIACEDIQYQVFSVDTFEDADNLPDAEFDDDGNLTDTTYDPGGVSDVVLVRVVYNYNITTPLMQAFLTNNADNTRTMMATIVLQTEPYQFEDS